MPVVPLCLRRICTDACATLRQPRLSKMTNAPEGRDLANGLDFRRGKWRWQNRLPGFFSTTAHSAVPRFARIPRFAKIPRFARIPRFASIRVQIWPMVYSWDGHTPRGYADIRGDLQADDLDGRGESWRGCADRVEWCALRSRKFAPCPNFAFCRTNARLR